MNIIVDKLNLPYDMKREICKYCYDELGYTTEDLKAIEKITEKKRNKFMKLRQKLELSHWWWSGALILKRAWYKKGYWIETKLFRGYNGNRNGQYPDVHVGGGYNHKRISDPDNNFIEKLLEEGDSRRRYGKLGLNPWPGSEWNPVTRRRNNYRWNGRRWIYHPNF